MKATKQLKDEHEGIKIMLDIMEKIADDIRKGKDLNVPHYENILDFIKGFADKCHHGKEEEVLFPAMEKKGFQHDSGPIAVMLEEHEQGRSFIRTLNKAFNEYKNGNKNVTNSIVQNSMSYVHLLRNHIEKENHALFMMADNVLSESEQEKILEEFERIEKEKIGIGKHNEYHALLKGLKQIYLPS